MEECKKTSIAKALLFTAGVFAGVMMWSLALLPYFHWNSDRGMGIAPSELRLSWLIPLGVVAAVLWLVGIIIGTRMRGEAITFEALLRLHTSFPVWISMVVYLIGVLLMIVLGFDTGYSAWFRVNVRPF